MKEIPRDTVKELVTSKTIQEGGIPKWMYEESYLSIIENLDKRLALMGIRIAFIKEED